ncbi:hypothetical protein EIP86_005681 [Pleurotus ostreatoroseus]|nr:hypothetical protein EIP86_005681 [Pleurotus ostreatoroseus]
MRGALQRSLRHSLAFNGPRRAYHATVLPSLLSTTSPEFRAKAESMDAVVSEFESKVAAARLGGGLKAAERMRSKGKKLPRERYANLAAHDVYPDHVPGAGIITGIGRIAGRECVVVVNDATVKGGSYYPMTSLYRIVE